MRTINRQQRQGEINSILRGDDNPVQITPRDDSDPWNIITDAAEAARVLRRSNVSRDIISRGDFKIDDNPNPDDPSNPVINISVGPSDVRHISRKTFILALVAIGTTAAAITEIFTALKRQNGKISDFKIPVDPGKNRNQKDTKRDFGLDNEREETEAGSVDQPLDFNVKLPAIDFDQLPKMFSQIPKLELTKALRDAGLTDRVELYNKYIDQFNNASTKNDNFDKAHWSGKIMQLKMVMEGAFPGQTRLDTAVPLGDTVKVDLPQPDYKLGVGMKPIVLTDDMIKKGVAPIINLYNEYVDNFNQAVIDGDMRAQTSWVKNIKHLYEQSKLSYATGAAGVDTAKADTNFIRSVTKARQSKSALEEAIKNGASPEHLARLKLEYNESKAYQDYSESLDHATGAPKTYWRDIVSEKFPTNSDETTAFNRIQEIEKQLHTYINPTDKTNQALVEYNSFTLPDGASTDTALFYKARLDKLNELVTKYNIPIAATKTSGDDEFSFVSNVVETDQTHDTADSGRADDLVGGEALELMTTQQERESEQKRWEEYSLVQPGHGNGRTNPLFMENLRDYNMQFGALEPPMVAHVPVPLPARVPERDPRMQNIYQIDTDLQDEYDNDPFSFTEENPTSVVLSDFENSRSGYHPNHVLRRSRSKPVRILQFRTDGQRFAPHGYNYGERQNINNGAVARENVPYPNATGFSKRAVLPSYEYALARKSKY